MTICGSLSSRRDSRPGDDHGAVFPEVAAVLIQHIGKCQHLYGRGIVFHRDIRHHGIVPGGLHFHGLDNTRNADDLVVLKAVVLFHKAADMDNVGVAPGTGR